MNNMKIEIKKMSKSDVDGVHEIERRVFVDPWTKQAFLSDLKNDFASPIVALFDGKVAGYASLYQAADELQIGNLAVSPDFHQRGIGTRLLEYIINLAHDNQKRLVVLEVRESNTAALNLYKKFGFKVAGKRKYYYHKPVEDAIIMIRGVE
jgi:ribosomal-protein-alanine N-acetyltransferase